MKNYSEYHRDGRHYVKVWFEHTDEALLFGLLAGTLKLIEKPSSDAGYYIWEVC